MANFASQITLQNIWIDIANADRNELQKRLYFLMLLLEGTGAPPPATQKPKLNSWQKYLNSLCQLVDRDKAGKTVTAIAARKKNSGISYVVGANNEDCKEAIKHLRWIFGVLVGHGVRDTAYVEKLEDAILHRSIEFCRKKVSNYANLLRKQICSLTKDEQFPNCPDDTKLLEALRLFTAQDRDPIRLCFLAKSIADNPDLMYRIKCLGEIDGPDRRWFFIRHNIRRLCTWHWAARRVVKMIEKHPLLGREVGFDVVENPTTERITLALSGSIDMIIAMLFPGCETAWQKDLRRSIEIAHERDPVAKIRKILESGPHMVRAHAEAVVFEMFHQQGWEFIRNDRYVGCSKPSCYACRLFFENHPSKLEMPLCHNNVWRKWLCPSSPDLKHFRTITLHAYRDLLQVLSIPRSQASRRPDSATLFTESTIKSVQSSTVG